MTLLAKSAVVLAAGVVRPPGAEDARRDLMDELRQPGYWRTWWSLVRQWLADRLALPSGESGLGAVVTSALVALALLLVVAVTVLVVRRTRGRTSPALSDDRVFAGEAALSADEYRRRASDHLTAGRHEAAFLDAFRAMAAGAVARRIVHDSPELTAHEVVGAVSVAHPNHAAGIRTVGGRFDEVLYGDGHADRPDALDMLALEATLGSAQPVPAGGATSTPAIPR